MHRLTLISVGKHGTPVGIYLSPDKVNKMLEMLEDDNPEDNPDKVPHIDYILFENISHSIREALELSVFESIAKGIRKAMDLNSLLLQDCELDPDKFDRLVRDCIFLFLAAYPDSDLFSEYQNFLIKEKAI